MGMAYTDERLPAGMRLVRYYDPDFAWTVDQQCHPRSYYAALEQQSIVPLYRDQATGLMLGGLGYYTLGNGYNKLTGSVELHVLSPVLKGTPAWPSDFGGADALALGGGRTRIRLDALDLNREGHRMASAFSHEMGHALHNWAEVYGGYDIPGFSADFRALWERAVSLNRSTYDPNLKPWRDPWDKGERPETGAEQFANASRLFFGVEVTRGSSGPANLTPPHPDPVVPGFADPKANGAWGKMLRLLPELAAYVKANGYRPGTLRWDPGAHSEAGAWELFNGRGEHIRQEDYWRYFHRTPAGLVAIWPQYTR